MKGYESPSIEFVDFEASDIFTTETSTCNYQCPNSYGSTCTELPYFGD